MAFQIFIEEWKKGNSFAYYKYPDNKLIKHNKTNKKLVCLVSVYFDFSGWIGAKFWIISATNR